VDSRRLREAWQPEPGPAAGLRVCWVSFNARPYLLWLSLTGRLRLDWGWLLGIGVLKRWRLIASQLGLPWWIRSSRSPTGPPGSA
jgi:hypothetical protein